MNVAEKIGEEYKEWSKRDKIFISAPTGAGKTYFILNVLLKYARDEGRKILFLVNRRILKKQVEKDILKLDFESRCCIQVELYQTLENEMGKMIYEPEQQCMRAAGYKALKAYENYDYVVCDECHYFLTDSNYNTNTAMSYRWIQEYFFDKVRIYMSATIKEFQTYMEIDDERRKKNRTYLYQFDAKTFIGTELIHKRKTYCYPMDKNYDYVDVHIIENRDEIVDLVTGNDGKWLIFIDSIAHGRELENKIRAEFDGMKKQKSVVMITADYEEDEESAEEVEKIVNNNEFSADVLISTSVMDNGVNIKDYQLRNIVLFSDTEDEFIQVLGRKRDDKKILGLYIYKWTKVHFQNRCKRIHEIQVIADKYLENFLKGVKEPLGVNENADINYYRRLEKNLVYGQHCKFMRDLARGKIRFEDVRKLFLVYEGCLYLNFLSFQHLENLIQYYYQIIQRFDEEGEDAFLKVQLGWLGKKEEEIARILSEYRMSQEEKDRIVVVDAFNQVVNQKKSREEAIEFKKSINEQLVRLAKSADCEDKAKKTAISAFSKTDRPISEPNMKFLKNFCDIPYVLEEKNGEYTIKAVSE